MGGRTSPLLHRFLITDSQTESWSLSFTELQPGHIDCHWTGAKENWETRTRLDKPSKSEVRQNRGEGNERWTLRDELNADKSFERYRGSQSGAARQQLIITHLVPSALACDREHPDNRTGLHAHSLRSECYCRNGASEAFGTSLPGYRRK